MCTIVGCITRYWQHYSGIDITDFKKIQNNIFIPEVINDLIYRNFFSSSITSYIALKNYRPQNEPPNHSALS